MSVKNNQLLGAAALALGLTVAPNLPPVAEGLLDNLAVLAMAAAEVPDNTGRVLVFVTVLDGADQVVRAVADSNGNVRLFADGSAMVALSKKINLVPGALVRFVRAVKTAAVGDPIVSLKAKYKRMKVEAATAGAKHVELLAKQSAAVSLGWDTALGSPEHDEFTDIEARVSTLNEWRAAVDAIRVQLASALTSAGIDPATVV